MNDPWDYDVVIDYVVHDLDHMMNHNHHHHHCVNLMNDHVLIQLMLEMAYHRHPSWSSWDSSYYSSHPSASVDSSYPFEPDQNPSSLNSAVAAVAVEV